MRAERKSPLSKWGTWREGLIKLTFQGSGRQDAAALYPGSMEADESKRRSGQELYEIVLTVEELLGGELTGNELAELVNAADPVPKPPEELQ